MAQFQGSRNLPNARKYAVTKQKLGEGIKASLYDIQTYAAAGQSSLAFFQVPVGQSGKTIADTNMKSAGQLSAGNQFVVEGIELLFFPGASPMTAGAAAAATNFANDVYAVAKSGSLDFKILDKSYVEEAPLGRFPSRTGLDVRSSLAIDVVEATAEAQLAMDYARMSGQPYAVNPAVTLTSNMAFNVTLNWPSVVALPSTDDARIGIVLNGILFRDVQ